MKINIIAAGNRMPDWVESASQEYIKRLPPELKINNIQLPLIKRGKNPDFPRIIRDESRKLLEAVPENNLLIVLDVRGKQVSTEQLSSLLGDWMLQRQDIAIIIGGPDGVSRELLDQASLKISLSSLTFPHPLVKVVLVEQLYRSWSILNNHPYHRA